MDNYPYNDWLNSIYSSSKLIKFNKIFEFNYLDSRFGLVIKPKRVYRNTYFNFNTICITNKKITPDNFKDLNKVSVSFWDNSRLVNSYVFKNIDKTINYLRKITSNKLVKIIENDSETDAPPPYS